MSKIMKKSVCMLVVFVLSVSLLNMAISEKIYKDYKMSGELYCAINGYNYKHIDKVKVVEYALFDFPFLNTVGTWYFTNGWSSNCYVDKKEKNDEVYNQARE
jgi:hypothetical protein